MIHALLSLGLAQSVELNCVERDGQTICFRAETELELEGASATGTIEGPGIAVVAEPVHKPFNPLIELRQDFDAEIAASAQHIR